MSPKAATPETSTGLLAVLFAPRRLSTLLMLAFAIGAAHVASMFSWRFIVGTAPFWDFPRGIVPGGTVDMGQELVGYLYLAHGPWGLPLLHVPNLLSPAGSNAFWLDPVPWLALLGRIIREITGHGTNLFGLYVALAFALPGVAMTWVLALTGQRSLVAAIAAALLADAAPFLLFEWGHVALCGQALAVFALALYLLALQRPSSRGVAAAWYGLLVLTFLTHLYLFVMVGGIWTAGVVQRAFDRSASSRFLAREAAGAVSLIVAVALLTGILSWQDRSGGTFGFGVFSLNLGSPFVPQLSGAIPPLRHYWIGMHSQVLGYLGLGALLVLAFAASGLVSWLRANARRHAALLAVMAGFYFFALSDIVTLGSHVLLHIPLPQGLAYALGAFRASGRFFWPVADALIALSVLTVLRRYRPMAALAILMAAGVVQMVDVYPIRQAVAASTRRAVPAVLDRMAVSRMLAQAHGVMIFPSSGCIGSDAEPSRNTQAEIARLAQANVEIQLQAAWRNLPINSAVNSRIATDCATEAQTRDAPRRPGFAYFYLTSDRPGPADACQAIDWVRACMIPNRPRG